MIGFEEAAATKSRYSDNNINMPASITLGLKSTPIAQGLVKDTNEQHTYLRV